MGDNGILVRNVGGRVFVNTGDNVVFVKNAEGRLFVNTGDNVVLVKNVVALKYAYTKNRKHNVKSASVKSYSKGGSCVKANGAIRTETQSTKDIVGCVLCGHSRTNL